MPKPVVQAANMGISRRQLPTMQCEKGHEGAHRNTKPRPLISARQQASVRFDESYVVCHVCMSCVLVCDVRHVSDVYVALCIID